MKKLTEVAKDTWIQLTREADSTREFNTKPVILYVSENQSGCYCEWLMRVVNTLNKTIIVSRNLIASDCSDKLKIFFLATIYTKLQMQAKISNDKIKLELHII